MHASKALPITLSKFSSLILLGVALFCFPPINIEHAGEGDVFICHVLLTVLVKLFCLQGKKIA